ncbi:MAG: SpoIIE family protein phosphatase [Clostridia bacterium]|nr:SpoIIE family protein phosphatase [Clostridia bacterium]
MKKWLKPMIITVLAVLAARCDFLEGMYPVGIAVLASAYMSKSFFFLFSGAVLGALTIGFNNDTLINLLPYALFLPCALLLRNRRIEVLVASMALACTVFFVPACTVNVPIYTRVVLVFNGLISACLVPVIKRLYRSFLEIESRLSLEHADVTAICFVGALAVSSLPKTDIFGFDIRIFALLFSSSLALTAFEARGSIWASVAGIIWVVKGGDVTTALILITGGILGGMLQKKRGGILLGFVLGDIIISLFMLNTFTLSLKVLNLLAGCLFTVFLKEDFVMRLKRLSGLNSGVNDLEMNYIQGLRDVQKAKIEGAARMYRELSKAFVSVNFTKEFKERLIKSTGKVCEDCNKYEYCFKMRKSDTVSEMAMAAEKITESGKLTEMPVTLTARCVQPMALVEEMNNAFLKEKTALDEAPDAQKELAGQMKGISDMLFSLARDIEKLPQFDSEMEKQAENVLSSRIGNVKRVTCLKSGESHILSVWVKENNKNTRDRIIEALNDGFVGTYRCLTGGTDAKGGFFGEFAPVPRFSVSSCTLRQNKRGEEVCGDSFAVINSLNGRYIAAISDGAGSGERARRESEGALDLLEAFSCAHVSRKETFSVMNRLLLLKGESEDYSTVDVTDFDLENGVLYWTKIGAVPGYILRGERVERVEAGALPMGIVTRIDPVTVKKLVLDGDVIVLVSDGVYDGLCKGNEDGISEILINNKGDSLNELAGKILSLAKAQETDDDMTVMVLKVNAA